VLVSWKVRDLAKGVDYNIRSIIDPHQADSQRGQWFEMLCEAGGAP
jgi:hypothetical protein